jgi:chromosomal replication initiation ATPase DnaA
VSLQQIIADTALAHGLRVADLKGHDLARKIVRARQEAMWAAREVKRPDGRNRYSFPQIGAAFNRDHSTVVHGAKAHRDRIAEHTGNIPYQFVDTAEYPACVSAKHNSVTA